MSDNNTQPGYDQGQQSAPPQPYPQQQYPPPQPQYPPPPPQYPNQWPPMKIGDWIVTMLLLSIPIVNFVLIIMWAFGSNVNPSKKSYFQAYLILALIGTVIGILIGVLFATAIMAALGELAYLF